MIIRKADRDDAPAIAGCLLLAMQDIVFSFIGDQDIAKAKDFLSHFVKHEDNQYSYQNCWVVELNNEIIAAVNAYDGADLKQLRAPVINYLRKHHNLAVDPEDETQAGEYYIDSLGVSEEHQGKGIGSKLLQFLIQDLATGQVKTIGLLVDEENAGAKKLYLKLGFKSIGYQTLMKKPMEHLQLTPSNLSKQ